MMYSPICGNSTELNTECYINRKIYLIFSILSMCLPSFYMSSNNSVTFLEKIRMTIRIKGANKPEVDYVSRWKEEHVHKPLQRKMNCTCL